MDESMRGEADSEANPWQKLIEEVMNRLNSHVSRSMQRTRRSRNL